MMYKLSVPCLNKWTAEMETKLIKKGMENIEKGTCVRFVPRTHQRDFIDIQPKSGWGSITWLSFVLKCFICSKMQNCEIQNHLQMINNPGAGPTLVHAVEGRPCPSRAPAASESEWFPTNSCTPWALCTSSPALTGTTMSPSCGQTFGEVIFSKGRGRRDGTGGTVQQHKL